MRALAEPHQRFRKVRVGVHRDVSGDVVENVRLRQVIQPPRRADADGGGEFATAQAIEKSEGRHVSRDRAGPETGQGRQETVDVLQTRDAICGETQGLNPGLETLVGILIPAWEQPLVEPPPRLVILGGVALVRLADV